MKRIFISHAAADKQLADWFVDFLLVGCGVDMSEIFCSSLEGIGIPEGKDFYDTIHEAIAMSDFVIMLITPAYYESTFCVCELGATWVLEQECFPMVVPPLTYADLAAVLTPIQAAMINDSGKLDNLIDRLKGLGLSTIATSRFNLKRDVYLEKFKNIKIGNKTSVSAESHFELVKKYDDLMQEFLKQETELKLRDTQFKELAKKKDPSDVTEVLLGDSDEPEQFEMLCENVRNSSVDLPKVALEAIYCGYRNEPYMLPDYYYSKEVHAAADSASEREFVIKNEGEVTPDYNHPSVSEAISSLDELKQFMVNASDAFMENYKSENRHQFSFENRDLWELHLGL